MFKQVLKGLDRMDTAEIMNLIKEATETVPVSVTQLGQGSPQSGQFYLVAWKAGEMNSKTINQCRHLGNYIVKWESPHKRESGPTQCTNCSKFGHGQKNCHCNPTCLYCAGTHHFSECPAKNFSEETRQPFLKCANCALTAGTNSKHSANDENCPARAEAWIRRKGAGINQKKPVLKKVGPRPFTSTRFENGSPSFADVTGNGLAPEASISPANRDFLQKMRQFCINLGNAKTEQEKKLLAIDYLSG